MFAGSATAAFFVFALALSPAVVQSGMARQLAKSLRLEIAESRKLECVFGKEGAPSKVTIKLASKNSGDDGSVYNGRIWLDKKLMFGDSIKFLYSKTEDGKATLGAGVLTQKRTLFYTELFINYDPDSGEATFEAATNKVSTKLQGRCTLN
ncbi:hypothetical protein [Methylocystis echinoides]|jgi:hypothetical protein|uniref:hypothetical protein n=1 Tax=Methylocystis echinoides TaxID=29468 RepID=UPI003435AC42